MKRVRKKNRIVGGERRGDLGESVVEEESVVVRERALVALGDWQKWRRKERVERAGGNGP